MLHVLNATAHCRDPTFSLTYTTGSLVMCLNHELQHECRPKFVLSKQSYQHLLDLHVEGRSSGTLC